MEPENYSPDVKINPLEKEINWQQFLNEKEQFFGIETFTLDFLQNVSAEELIRNILLFKPQLILNEVLLRSILTTPCKKNRMKVYLLLKLISKNFILYDQLANKSQFWKSIYHFFYPYSVLFRDNNLSKEDEISQGKLIMQKLSVMHEFHVQKELNEQGEEVLNLNRIAYSMVSREDKKHFSIGALTIDHEIKRICISKGAIFILNEYKQVIEYYPGIPPIGTYMNDINNIIHQNSKIIFTNVKEMINIETEEETQHIPISDNCIVVLTYSGELFFHKIIRYRVSYTVKFDLDFMKQKLKLDNFKVLNIQCCDNLPEYIAFELEDHSIYYMNVRFLFLLISNLVSPLNEEYAKYFNQPTVSTTSLSGYIPLAYFAVELENGYSIIFQTVNGREFIEEKDLSFTQKISRKSPRLFTMYMKNLDEIYTFYFDKEGDTMNKTLYVSIYRYEFDKDFKPIQIVNTYEIPEMNFKLPSSNIQQITFLCPNATYGEHGMKFLFDNQLQIKCDNKFYWLNIIRNKIFEVETNPPFPQEDTPDNPLNINVNDFVSEQPDESTNVLFLTIEQKNQQIINEIKQVDLIELQLPDKLVFKEIFYSFYNDKLYSLTTDGKLLINNYKVASPMVMN